MSRSDYIKREYPTYTCDKPNCSASSRCLECQETLKAAHIHNRTICDRGHQIDDLRKSCICEYSENTLSVVWGCIWTSLMWILRTAWSVWVCLRRWTRKVKLRRQRLDLGLEARFDVDIQAHFCRYGGVRDRVAMENRCFQSLCELARSSCVLQLLNYVTRAHSQLIQQYPL